MKDINHETNESPSIIPSIAIGSSGSIGTILTTQTLAVNCLSIDF